MNLLAVGVALILSAFAISYAACWLVRWVAPRVGLVDRPGGRKAHRRPTPLGGGVAIWLSTVAMLVLGAITVFADPGVLPETLAQHVGGLRERAGELLGIMGLATAIMIMGLIDDRKGLGWKPRLAIQFALAATFVLVWGRVTLFLPDALFFRVLSFAVTVLWIVGLTNAFNFLDNMDGLAASVGLIAAALFVAAQVAVGSLFVPAVLMILIGSLVGFLAHNWNPARLFMGDAGSNFLGFLLGVLTVTGTFTKPYDRGDSPLGALAPLLVMAVPLYDTFSVILIRLREGRSPFQPDRCHFSHRLVERGLTAPGAVATIDLVTLACGLGALLLHRLDGPGAAIVVAQVACLLGLVAVLEVSTGKVKSATPLAAKSEDGPERRHGEASSEVEGPISPRLEAEPGSPHDGNGSRAGAL